MAKRKDLNLFPAVKIVSHAQFVRIFKNFQDYCAADLNLKVCAAEGGVATCHYALGKRPSLE